ncbi:FKBP-type peptidyl-prolyl cis-trans isomerase [Mucilaginibacter lappiensis]|uniref:Peptidyl-prolyl cis-trans isomerase n=1 Tax=Mucilaginibacter lappiensis TaxID=354630 RepID=A0A841JB78_9SPHI|nr:FKBP-type peptidyl-prolyl cis-trans isomerase [Mucilaginibacter lappiensis]MBB6110465.1 FKBP-type peptidyl-prolyl cis-trans isomerase [Mucilaginibacter lappiensis]MBB6128429.1 FKBP-type peptidyl-prolyl cis-trans isomerase [Mucilaginibacter lappiensis]
MKRYFVLLGLAIITLSACLKTDPQKPPVVVDPATQAATDDAAIKTYLAAHTDITATKDTTTGLYYQIVNPGTGPANPSGGSNVTISFTGKLLNDNPFDSEVNYQISLSGAIPGLTIGVPLIKKGGRIILLIPSKLGYGNVANGPIPPNSVLIFTIDLISIN